MSSRVFHRIVFPSIVLCSTVLFAAKSAFAQVEIEVEEANVIGEVVRISPLSLTVKTALGPYEVDVVNREFKDLGPARIEVTGEKPLKYLERGMMVRFEGVLENGRKVREPLAEVTVLDPAALSALGGGAIRPIGAGGKRPDAGEDDVEVNQVFVGKVRFYRLGVLSVEVPGERKPKTIQANLTDDAVVRLSSGSLAAARPGDKVQVKGWKDVDARARRIWAQQVTVTSSDEPADTRVARGANPKPGGPRRAFGDVGAEAPKKDDPAGDDVEYEGIILEIN
jgi:hypothetical protein